MVATSQCQQSILPRLVRKKRVCKIWAMKHPTGLHGYVPRWKVGGAADNSKDGDSDTVKTNFGEMDVKSSSGNMVSKIISMCVVPIKITHAVTKREVSTFAMLDIYSQGCFIKNNIRERLGASGRKTEIIIKTLNGDGEVASTVISGLMVASDMKGVRQHWFDLPATYTREKLPADVEEMATRDKVVGWEHLKELVEKAPRKSDIEIGLLIGAKCAKALEPQEIIPSKNGGPFTFRSPLGWCVVGPLTKSPKKSITCNRVLVKDAVSGNIALHYFGILDEIKDVSAKQMLKLMYNTDFSETRLEGVGTGSANLEEFSYEDKKFLEMMDESTKKVDRCYQLPLPLKNHGKFPNNRYLAEKILQYLKGRFIKNPTFFMDYKGFIDDLIKKGYAEKSTKEAPEGRTWCIPHHGVYDPSKPGKMRVVFECSTEFKEVSLNKNLMSGPDLNNHTVGVLTRFRDEPAVIMGDIESMFHQLMVPKEDRSFLGSFGGKIMTSMVQQRILKCVFMSLEELLPQVAATMH